MRSSPRMSMSVLLKCLGVPRGVCRELDARAGRRLSVRGVSTCSRRELEAERKLADAQVSNG